MTFVSTIFSSFSPGSRLWIYQSDRILMPSEVDAINQEVNTFCAQWDSHGQPVNAAGEVIDQLFLLLVADETSVTVGGCSMDRSVRFIKSLGEKWNINFFDRLRLAVQTNEGWSLLSPPYTGLTRDMYFHNNSITRLNEWHNRILPVSGNWPASFTTH